MAWPGHAAFDRPVLLEPASVNRLVSDLCDLWAPSVDRLLPDLCDLWARGPDDRSPALQAGSQDDLWAPCPGRQIVVADVEMVRPPRRSRVLRLEYKGEESITLGHKIYLLDLSLIHISEPTRPY